MELRTFNDIKNNIYALRLWSVGPYGYNTPFEKLLPVCRDTLKTEVCDKLGLDVDEVIATMIKNQEYFEYNMDDGTTLLYTYYVINNQHIWFTDVRWDENKKEGDIYDTCISINLNNVLNINNEYVVDKDNNDINIIDVPSDSASGVSYCRYTCRLNKSIDKPDVYELIKMRNFRSHGSYHSLSNIFSDDPWVGAKAWRFFTEKNECDNYVNTVFSTENDIKYKKAELAKQYKAAVKKYNFAKSALEKASNDVESIKKQYFELTGEQL